MLRKVAENIWVAEAPHQWFGLHFGTRMTVIRLASGALVLHSPIPLSSELRAEVGSLGKVQHIVCPNYYHHVYAGEAVRLYPKALLYGPRELWGKRPDLPFKVVLSECTPENWEGELLPLTIGGCMLRETVLFHPATKTLISSDLVGNFEGSSHFLTRLYLKLAGTYGRVGWNRLLRFLYQDRKAARESIDRLLAWPIERAIVAHGDLILKDPRQAIAKAFEWL